MKFVLRYGIPLGIFLLLTSFFWHGLRGDPHQLPSTLINQTAPSFSLPSVTSATSPFTQQDLIGHLSIVNIWASWCSSCYAEHAFLMHIAKQSPYVTFYGIAYKDQNENVKHWLHTLGNPYQKVGLDVDGQVSIEWGVYGTPETYLVDSHSIIRYKHTGPLTTESWQQQFLPLIQQLQKTQ